MTQALIDLQTQVANLLATTRDSVLAPTTKSIKPQNGKLLLPNGLSVMEVNVIVLSWRWMNRLFAGPWNPTANTAVSCWALGKNPMDLKPDTVPKPQSSTCASCPKNQFGSAISGRGKACRNQVVLACLPADGVGDIVTISLPPTSLQNFSKYVTSLAIKTLIPTQIITKVKLDTDTAYAKFAFTPVEILSDSILATALALQAEAEEYLESKDTRLQADG